MSRIAIKLQTVMVLVMLTGAACTYGSGGTPAPPSKETVAAGPVQPSQQGEWDQLVNAARREGKLMIYSTPSGELVREVGQAFEKRFGVEVEFVVGRGEELARRIEAERSAGLYLTDVFISGGGTLLTTLKPAGLLARLEPMIVLPEVTDPNAWITGSIPFLDKDRTAIGMAAAYQRYVLRNTDFVKPTEITSYKDILNPKWKGKVAFNDPTVTGTGKGFLSLLAVYVWGLEPTRDFMRQFVKQEPGVTRDRRLQAEWVARGRYPLSVATNIETASTFIKMGSPLAYVKVEEGSTLITGSAGLGVPVRASHPNAAKVFVNWLLSREGHARFIKWFGNPGTRRDAPREGIPEELFAEPDEKIYLQTEEFILFGAEIERIAREIFAPLLK